MNGQEYCRAVFAELFFPALEQHFPEILPRLSAGVIGRGSEVLGDHAFSRDHGWGPGSCKMFLPEADVKRCGNDIREKLAAPVPTEFHGVTTGKLIPDAIRVATIDSVYAESFGMIHPPDNLDAWYTSDSNNLCFAHSGAVIYDPSGALTARQDAFRKAYYPDDIWKCRLAEKLWPIWHYGDYNRDRMLNRSDRVGLLVAQGHCVDDVMNLVCLLNRRFPIYWKWLHWQFKQLPNWAPQLELQLQELASTSR